MLASEEGHCSVELVHNIGIPHSCLCVCVCVCLCVCVCVGCVCMCACVRARAHARFFKYIYSPCTLHYHAATLHALFTHYMLFLSILYTFNILLSIYCALVIVPDYCVCVHACVRVCVGLGVRTCACVCVSSKCGSCV